MVMQDLETGSVPPPVQSTTPEDTVVGTCRLDRALVLGAIGRARPNEDAVIAGSR